MTWYDGIPLILPLAEFFWGNGEEEAVLYSADICLSSLPFLTVACFQRLIVKGLGIGIILGSFLNKAPIIVNIWNAQSAAGLAKASIYGDVIMYSNTALYGILQGFPVTAYGENLALLGQSLVIVVLAWKFSKTPFTESLLAIVCIAAYWLGSMYVLPSEYQYLLMASITPVLLYSRGSQVWENWVDKHTGTQAIATLVMNTAGGIIRIGTTIAEVGWDIPVLTGFGTGVFLSILLLIQYFAYQSNTQRVLQNLKQVDPQKTKSE
mmetsp:Transcript_3517/g.5994  ORF Transcript_3517/g.5994 Transcript_3517/m.5994 type:complete len:265 (-) Transcript_3517:1992-2786(-)